MKLIKKGKLIFFLIFHILITVLAGAVPVYAESCAIKDLHENSDYSNGAILRLLEKGVITGDDTGRFNPAENITRSQMAAIISRLLRLDRTKLPEKPTFKDVPASHWAFPYIEAAYREGIIKGITADTFGTDAYCTREEMTVMLVRSLGTSDEIAGYKNTDKLLKLSDGHKLSSWSRDYVGLALSRGLVTGNDNGSFNPAEYATREEAAVVADRFMDRYPVLNAANTVAGTLALKELAALEESVVLIKTFDKDNNGMSQGSGFAIADGLFLTNWHVLEGASKYTITDARGKEHEIQGVVKYDAELDLAVIKSRELIDIKPLAIGSRNSLAAGDEVVAIGSPHGLQNSISDGNVINLREEIYGSDKKLQIIEMLVDITHGSSGGPLLDMQGRVAGVVTAMAEDGIIKYAVAIDHAVGWINDLKSKPFSGLKVLDMKGATEAYWRTLDDEVRDTINASLEALEEENLEAYVETIHKMNPAYKTIGLTYGKLLSIYDFEFTLGTVKLVNKDPATVNVEVTYKVKRTGENKSLTLDALGHYKLARQGDKYRIFYATETFFNTNGGLWNGVFNE